MASLQTVISLNIISFVLGFQLPKLFAPDTSQYSVPPSSSPSITIEKVIAATRTDPLSLAHLPYPSPSPTSLPTLTPVDGVFQGLPWLSPVMWAPALAFLLGVFFVLIFACSYFCTHIDCLQRQIDDQACQHAADRSSLERDLTISDTVRGALTHQIASLLAENADERDKELAKRKEIQRSAEQDVANVRDELTKQVDVLAANLASERDKSTAAAASAQKAADRALAEARAQASTQLVCARAAHATEQLKATRDFEARRKLQEKVLMDERKRMGRDNAAFHESHRKLTGNVAVLKREKETEIAKAARAAEKHAKEMADLEAKHAANLASELVKTNEALDAHKKALDEQFAERCVKADAATRTAAGKRKAAWDIWEAEAERDTWRNAVRDLQGSSTDLDNKLQETEAAIQKLRKTPAQMKKVLMDEEVRRRKAKAEEEAKNVRESEAAGTSDEPPVHAKEESV